MRVRSKGCLLVAQGDHPRRPITDDDRLGLSSREGGKKERDLKSASLEAEIGKKMCGEI